VPYLRQCLRRKATPEFVVARQDGRPAVEAALTAVVDHSLGEQWFSDVPAERERRYQARAAPSHRCVSFNDRCDQERVDRSQPPLRDDLYEDVTIATTRQLIRMHESSSMLRVRVSAAVRGDTTAGV
jgi:hypothetical protein